MLVLLVHIRICQSGEFTRATSKMNHGFDEDSCLQIKIEENQEDSLHFPLSDYAKKVETHVKDRYLKKILKLQSILLQLSKPALIQIVYRQLNQQISSVI